MTEPAALATGLSWAEATAAVLAKVKPEKTRTVPLLRALGMVLAEDLVADADVPGQALAATDGYAVCAADSPGEEGRSLRLVAFLRSGRRYREMKVRPGEAVKIEEGVVLPTHAAMVVPADRVREEGGFVAVAPGHQRSPNVIAGAADFSAGDVVLPAGTRLGPRQLAILSYFGLSRPLVRRLPHVSILTVGSELCGLMEEPGPGEVRDVNAFLLAGIIKRLGGRSTLYGPAPDEVPAVAEILARAVRDSGVVVVTGGLGRHGLVTPQALERVGFKESVRLEGIRPAGAVRFGHVGDTAVFALPGHAFSAHVAFTTMVVPHLRRAAQELEWQPHLQTMAAAEGMDVNGEAVTFLHGERAGEGEVRLIPLDRETYLHNFGEDDLFVVVDRGEGPVQAGQPLLAHPFDTDRV